MILGLCGLGLSLLIGLISVSLGAEFYTPFIYDLGTDYFFASPFIMAAELCILYGILSIPMYFIGLNIFVLGRIAVNTEKETRVNKGVKKENSHTTSNTSKNAENKSTATDTADDYYYDIQCPHCHSDLSIIKNHTYKDGFECPYCSKKISI